jgi:hypothetical protein
MPAKGRITDSRPVTSTYPDADQAGKPSEALPFSFLERVR